MDVKFDIFQKLPDGQPVWVKAVEGLEEAKLQLNQIAQAIPGEYFIFDIRDGRKISPESNLNALRKAALSAGFSG